MIFKHSRPSKENVVLLICCLWCAIGTSWKCKPAPSLITADSIFICQHLYNTDNGVVTSHNAMVVNGDSIVAIGDSSILMAQYSCSNIYRIDGFIYPSFIDAHCHFIGLAKTLIEVDLSPCTSFEEVITQCIQWKKDNPESTWIVGRGWDESLWNDSQLPHHDRLNQLFPEIPVFIRRVDGHAALANQKAMDLAGIDAKSLIDGGKVVLHANGKPTGLLIDNAMNPIMKLLPEPDKNSLIKGIIKAGKICNAFGLTTLADAGLNPDMIFLIDSLNQSGDIHIRLYAMLSYHPENMSFAQQRGAIKTPRLRLHSFKFFADGALGSSGAKLKTPYCTQEIHNGLLLTPPDTLMKAYQEVFNLGFQAHTHCIGDSANLMVLHLYRNILHSSLNNRWRIEHAQVVDPNDFHLFGFDMIIPSVQPCHAVSDMRWAEKQLCSHRMPGAYAYQKLLQHTGILAIGTDFPIESPDPFANFYSAIARKNTKHLPPKGFMPDQKLKRTSTLLGMTYHAAYSLFMDQLCGSLSPGKKADFMILSHDLLTVEEDKIPAITCQSLYFDGIKLF
jgi:predicted amidohydrolase YtcJ